MAKNSVQEIAGMIAGKHGLSQQDAEAFVVSFFDLINDGLHNDKAVKVKGLGTFKVIDVRERESVNVNTGERVLIESHGKITFTADPVMRDLVNKPFAQFETVVLNDGVELEDIAKAQSDDDLDLTETDTDVAESDVYVSDAEISDSKVEQSCLHQQVEQNDDNVQIDTDTFYSGNDSACCASEKGKDIIEAENTVVAVDEQDNDNKFLDKETHSEDKDSLMQGPLDAADVVECASIYKEEASLCDDYAGKTIEPKDTEDDENVTTEGAAEGESVDDESERLQNKVIEQFVTSGRIEDGPDNSDTEKVKTSCGLAWYYWILIILVVGVAALFGGYYWGQYNAKPTIKYVSIRQVVPHTATGFADTVMHKDTVRNKEEVTKQISKDSVAIKKNIADKPVQQNVTQVSEPVVSSGSQELKNAATAVKTGAYRIVGTDCVVTVKKGETLKKLSKFYLGEGMECYVMVHNGITDIKEGMKLKIPKLESKRKQR